MKLVLAYAIVGLVVAAGLGFVGFMLWSHPIVVLAPVAVVAVAWAWSEINDSQWPR